MSDSNNELHLKIAATAHSGDSQTKIKPQQKRCNAPSRINTQS